MICSLLSATALAAGPASSGKMGFAEWQGAHPAMDARIHEIKRQTMSLIKAARLLPVNQADLNSPPKIWRVSEAIDEVWDAPDAPLMVVVPAGEYTMGPSATERHEYGEMTPRMRVRIGYAFAMSKYPVTVQEFRKFAITTGYDPGGECQLDEAATRHDGKWSNPGYDQTDDMPVVCINSDDAEAYVTWLSSVTGQSYRLPAEAEFEYARRAGTTTSYWWGDEIGSNNAVCNACGSAWDDKWPAPVGAFKANPFGLYDIGGNIWSRTADCWTEALGSGPFDGSANVSGDCNQAMVRGGGYRSPPARLRSYLRHPTPSDKRYNDDGLHVVRDL